MIGGIIIIKVFLGGTCNNSTWREELIFKLNNNKIIAFNPMVENWNEEARNNEKWHRNNDDFCVYVLTSEMIGDNSFIEIMEDSLKRPKKTIVCILEDKNKPFNTLQKIKVLLVKLIVSDNNIKYFLNLDEIADYLNNYEEIILKKNNY